MNEDTKYLMHDSGRPSFAKRLEELLNEYSVENESNTPDFILAEYILHCLQAWNATTKRREEWFGRQEKPHFSATPEQPQQVEEKK